MTPASPYSSCLQGKEGLSEVARVVAALRTLPVEINNSTGLHVHVAPAVPSSSSSSQQPGDALPWRICSTRLNGKCMGWTGRCSVAACPHVSHSDHPSGPHTPSSFSLRQ
jgi:hypothetical protein